MDTNGATTSTTMNEKLAPKRKADEISTSNGSNGNFKNIMQSGIVQNNSTPPLPPTTTVNYSKWFYVPNRNQNQSAKERCIQFLKSLMRTVESGANNQELSRQMADIINDLLIGRISLPIFTQHVSILLTTKYPSHIVPYLEKGISDARVSYQAGEFTLESLKSDAAAAAPIVDDRKRLQDLSSGQKKASETRQQNAAKALETRQSNAVKIPALQNELAELKDKYINTLESNARLSHQLRGKDTQLQELEHQLKGKDTQLQEMANEKSELVGQLEAWQWRCQELEQQLMPVVQNEDDGPMDTKDGIIN